MSETPGRHARSTRRMSFLQRQHSRRRTSSFSKRSPGIARRQSVDESNTARSELKDAVGRVSEVLRKFEEESGKDTFEFLDYEDYSRLAMEGDLSRARVMEEARERTVVLSEGLDKTRDRQKLILDSVKDWIDTRMSDDEDDDTFSQMSDNSVDLSAVTEEELTGSLLSTKRNLEKLKSLYEDLKQEIGLLRNLGGKEKEDWSQKEDELKAASKRLSEKLELANEKLIAAKKDVSEFGNQITQQSKELDRLETTVDVKQSRIRELESKLQKLQFNSKSDMKNDRRNAETTKQFKELLKKYENMENQLKNEQNRAEKTEKMVESVRDELRKEKEVSKDLSEEVNTLKVTASEASAAVIEEKTKDHQEEDKGMVTRIMKEYDSLKSENQRLKCEMERMNDEWEEKLRVGILDAELRNAEEKDNELDQIRKEFQNKYSAMKSSGESGDSSVSQLIMDYESKAEEMKRETESVKKEKNEINAKMDTMVEDMRLLASRLEDSNKTIERMRKKERVTSADSSRGRKNVDDEIHKVSSEKKDKPKDKPPRQKKIVKKEVEDIPIISEEKVGEKDQLPEKQVLERNDQKELGARYDSYDDVQKQSEKLRASFDNLKERIEEMTAAVLHRLEENSGTSALSHRTEGSISRWNSTDEYGRKLDEDWRDLDSFPSLVSVCSKKHAERETKLSDFIQKITKKPFHLRISEVPPNEEMDDFRASRAALSRRKSVVELEEQVGKNKEELNLLMLHEQELKEKHSKISLSQMDARTVIDTVDERMKSVDPNGQTFQNLQQMRVNNEQNLTEWEQKLKEIRRVRERNLERVLMAVELLIIDETVMKEKKQVERIVKAKLKLPAIQGHGISLVQNDDQKYQKFTGSIGVRTQSKKMVFPIPKVVTEKSPSRGHSPGHHSRPSTTSIMQRGMRSSSPQGKPSRRIGGQQLASVPIIIRRF